MGHSCEDDGIGQGVITDASSVGSLQATKARLDDVFEALLRSNEGAQKDVLHRLSALVLAAPLDSASAVAVGCGALVENDDCIGLQTDDLLRFKHARSLGGPQRQGDRLKACPLAVLRCDSRSG